MKIKGMHYAFTITTGDLYTGTKRKYIVIARSYGEAETICNEELQGIDEILNIERMDVAGVAYHGMYDKDRYKEGKNEGYDEGREVGFVEGFDYVFTEVLPNILPNKSLEFQETEKVISLDDLYTMAVEYENKLRVGDISKESIGEMMEEYE